MAFVRNAMFFQESSVMFSSSAFAQDVVYEPINPAFGGNTLNGTFLLGEAGAQNDFTATCGAAPAAPSIDFPDIEIDLGGIGGGLDDPTTPTTTTPDPTATVPTTN